MLVDDPSAPLELADGTKIDPETGSVINERRKAAFVEIPAPSVAQAIVAKSRKTVADLPAAPKELTGVALVAFYTLFGLSDADIALALEGKLTVDQVARIRTLDVYNEFMENAKVNIIDSSTDIVRDLFQKNAVGAAKTMIELAQSDNDAVAITASKDILDRAGHRPADVVEHKHKMDQNALNIVITHRDADQSLPVIDATPVEVNYESD